MGPGGFGTHPDRHEARQAALGLPIQMVFTDRLKSIFDVFSRREAARDPLYKADDIPERLRSRILLLYRDVLSGQWQEGWIDDGSNTSEFWAQMHNSLEHLHGRPWLSDVVYRGNPVDDAVTDAIAFLQKCTANEFFDFIELSFKLDVSWRALRNDIEMVEAVNEIFRVENAPFQLTAPVKIKEQQRHYMAGTVETTRISSYPKIIRADDDVVHSEAVVPALSVLSAPHFEAANEEFRDALSEYRTGHYEDCLTKCGSAFESVLKVLCKRNGWPFKETDTAAPLLKLVIANSALDSFFEQPLMLIATIRNRLSSSHGAGSNVRSVERQIGQYAVSSTAAAILLLVHEADT